MLPVTRSDYGAPDVLRVGETPTPRPGGVDLLVRVRATTVSRTDCGIPLGKPPILRLLTGLRRPRDVNAGTDFAGEVVAVGPAVDRFAQSTPPKWSCPGPTPGGAATMLRSPHWPGPAPSRPAAGRQSATASTVVETVTSTERCTTSSSPDGAAAAELRPTSPNAEPKARPTGKSDVASSDTSPDNSTANSPVPPLDTHRRVP